MTELAICRVAVLNRATYEWEAHAPLALKGGVSKQGLETCRTVEDLGSGGGNAVAEKLEGKKDGEGGLKKVEWAVMAYADQMTRNVRVDQEVSELIKGLLGVREVVELTATIAAYNCVSRFLVALDVGEKNMEEIKALET